MVRTVHTFHVDGLELRTHAMVPDSMAVTERPVLIVHDIVGEPPSVNAIVLTDYLRCGPRWFFTELAAMLEFRTEDAVASLTQPVLVVRGENDPIARRAWCEQLADCAVDGRLIDLPDARHVVQHTSAERMAEEVLKFSRIASADPSTS